MNYLASYNHSGNGWVRYCIEYLTQLPTYGHQPFSMSQRKDNFLNVDLSKPPIVIKTHEPIQLKDQDILILLIREPNDSIKENKIYQEEWDKYYNLFLCYENFSGKKCNIQYNQLFQLSTIKYIIDFYGLETHKWNEFEENFEKHKEESLSIHQHQIQEKGTNLDLYIPKHFLEHVRKYL